jgi:hypothetical protein
MSPIFVYIERPAYNLQKYDTGDVINFSIPVPPHARARGARGGAPLKPSILEKRKEKGKLNNLSLCQSIKFPHEPLCLNKSS